MKIILSANYKNHRKGTELSVPRDISRKEAAILVKWTLATELPQDKDKQTKKKRGK